MFESHRRMAMIRGRSRFSRFQLPRRARYRPSFVHLGRGAHCYENNRPPSRHAFSSYAVLRTTTLFAALCKFGNSFAWRISIPSRALSESLGSPQHERRRWHQLFPLLHVHPVTAYWPGNPYIPATISTPGPLTPDTTDMISDNARTAVLSSVRFNAISIEYLRLLPGASISTTRHAADSKLRVNFSSFNQNHDEADKIASSCRHR